MTLVAAFRINDVPVLLGDLLITDKPSDLPHGFLPTRPDLTRPNSGERRRIGARRKTLILNGNLSVGFTGTVDAGAILFRDLARRFSKSTPTPDELSYALRLHNIQLSKNATVVGWLANPKPRCFRWSAKPGAILEWPPHAILGSGATHFTRSILPTNISGQSDNLAAEDLAKLVAVTKATAVLGNELHNSGTLKNSYGYGLEVATWNGTAFESQRKLTFSFYNAMIGPGDNVQIQPVLIRIYEHHERYSLVQTSFIEKTMGPDGILDNHIMVDFVCPLHDECHDITLPRSTLDPHADLYCFGIAWTHAESKKMGFLHLTVDESHVRIEGDSRKFQLHARDTGALVKIIREAATRS